MDTTHSPYTNKNIAREIADATGLPYDHARAFIISAREERHIRPLGYDRERSAWMYSREDREKLLEVASFFFD